MGGGGMTAMIEGEKGIEREWVRWGGMTAMIV